MVEFVNALVGLYLPEGREGQGLVEYALILVLVLPAWPHSRRWGYGPSGLLAFLVVATLILMLTGIVPRP